ncbi:MAG: DUF2059 domain-containing protein [Deltaproteobacteria bacterium]|nr:DUF2059 domain-containing protein [Deltaproteobacteria bacterium]
MIYRIHRIIIVMSTLILLLNSVYADEAAKHQKTFELMELMPIRELFRDDYKLCLKRAEDYAPGITYENQPEYFGGISPNDPEWVSIVSSYKKYVSTMCSYISENEYIELIAKLYGEYLTEKELDVILDFFRSPIGQKELNASFMVRIRADEYFYKKMTEKEKKAYDDYMVELESIISRHQQK